MESRSRFDMLMKRSAWKEEIAGSDYGLLANAYEVALNADKGLIIKGGVGVGKTHFARALYPEAIFTDCASRDDVARLASMSNFGDRRYGDMILDDVGSEEPQNEYGIKRENVAEHIMWRYLLMMKKKFNPNIVTIGKLIITTNTDLSRYGERVTSRLAEMCIPVELTGKDKRTWTTLPKG